MRKSVEQVIEELQVQLKCYSLEHVCLRRVAETEQEVNWLNELSIKIDVIRDVLFALTGEERYNNDPAIKRKRFEEEVRKMLDPNFEALEEKKDFNEQCSGNLDEVTITAENIYF